MADIVVTDDVKRGIRQLREIEDRFLSGALDPRQWRAPLQDIIEGKFVTRYNVPSWYVSPIDQIGRVLDFLRLFDGGHNEGFRSSDFPVLPSNFVPSTPTEVLLLTVMLPDKDGVSGVQRTFDAWWDFITPPKGYRKWMSTQLKNSELLRLAPGIEHKPGIRWVAFDPSAYHGVSAEFALTESKKDGNTLAHAEVLMAAALFPQWPASWNGTSLPFPNMSGYQFRRDSDWRYVPDLRRWDGNNLQLEVSVSGEAHYIDRRWASPTVREL